MATAVGWKEILVAQLIDCEQRWFNRPRNNILYNFTGWTGSPDLIAALDTDVSSLLRYAARSIFDYDAQTTFGLYGAFFVKGASRYFCCPLSFHSFVRPAPRAFFRPDRIFPSLSRAAAVKDGASSAPPKVCP
jgi:hypothetical protein